MYHFAALALLALALFKLVDVLEDLVPGVTKYHTLATIVLGIAGAYALDYHAFSGYGVDFREEWMGTVATGLAIAGMTSVWRAAFHWLGSSEGEEPEVRHPLHGPRSMAA
jgi:hypothetical protein